jgi:molybdopterin synthase sulfur carrier subunit
MITVIVYGLTLRQLIEEPEVQCETPGPLTVKALLEGQPTLLNKLLPFMKKGELLVTVNRKVGSLDSVVRDGDTVKVTHQFNPALDGATWHNP